MGSDGLKNDVDIIVSTYIRSFAADGGTFTQAEHDRLRTSVENALKAGVSHDQLVSLDDTGANQPVLTNVATSARRTTDPRSGRPLADIPPSQRTRPDVEPRNLPFRVSTPDSIASQIDALRTNVGAAGVDPSGVTTELRRFGYVAPLDEPATAPGDDTAADVGAGFSPGEAAQQGYLDAIVAATQMISEADGSTEDGMFQMMAALELLNSAGPAYIDWKQLNEGGTLRLDDGTVITTDMLEDPDPVVASQALAQFTQQIGGKIEDYNLWAGELGLPQLTEGATSAAAQEANRAAQQSFANNLASLGAKLDIEDLTTRRSAAKVDRQLAGLAESRSRTDLTLDAILKSLPFSADPGQTSFTANQLGAGTAQLARLGGIDPSAALLNYTGQQNINPRGLLDEFDTGLGVGGPLEEIPDLGIGLGDVPGAPSLVGAGAGGPPPGSPAILSMFSKIGDQRTINAGAGLRSRITDRERDEEQGLF